MVLFWGYGKSSNEQCNISGIANPDYKTGCKCQNHFHENKHKVKIVTEEKYKEWKVGWLEK